MVERPELHLLALAAAAAAATAADIILEYRWSLRIWGPQFSVGSVYESKWFGFMKTLKMEVNRERARGMKGVVEERIYLKALGKKEGENDGSEGDKRGAHA